MSAFKAINVSIKSGLAIISFIRPEKRNAINSDVYHEITKALNEISDNDEVSVTAITGTGQYYCSGTDLTDIMGKTDVTQSLAEGAVRVGNFVKAFIDHKKVLVAVVNGPAIGIAVTTLALCDVVYCSDTATFNTPFTQLGMSCEGCSSYTFPRILGKSKASEMLFFNHKMTAQEALRVGFVSQIFTLKEIEEKVWPQLYQYAADIPVNSMVYSKQLIRKFEASDLHEANRVEVERLRERWVSEDCANAVMKFMMRRSKL